MDDGRASGVGGVLPNPSQRGSQPCCVARWHRGWARPRRFGAGAGARLLSAPRRSAGAVQRSPHRVAASRRPWRVRQRVAPAPTREAPRRRAGALRRRRWGRWGPPPQPAQRHHHRPGRPPARRWAGAGRRWSRGGPASWPHVGCRVGPPGAAGGPSPRRVPGGAGPGWIGPGRPWGGGGAGRRGACLPPRGVARGHHTAGRGGQGRGRRLGDGVGLAGGRIWHLRRFGVGRRLVAATGESDRESGQKSASTHRWSGREWQGG